MIKSALKIYICNHKIQKMTIRKYQENKVHPHPHIGALVRKTMAAKGISAAELSRRMGINSTGVSVYLRRSSLQFGILWDLGIELQHDFLLEIANHYPAGMELNQNADIVKELKEKTQQIADLRKEIDIYKNALGIRQQS